MPVTYSQNDTTRIAEITVDGQVEEADFDKIAGPLQDFIDHHGTIGFVEVVESLGSFDLSMIPKGIAFDIKNLKHISHAAIVTDIGWLSPITKGAGAFMSTKLRTFPLDQVDAAREWVKSELANAAST